MDFMDDREAQHRAHIKLLSAVVGLAVKDAQTTPIRYVGDKRRSPSPDALTGMQFLFSSDSDGYFALLNKNPQRFRKRLVEYMFETVRKKNNGQKDASYIGRRNFKFNYLWYLKNRRRAEELLMQAVSRVNLDDIEEI